MNKKIKAVIIALICFVIITEAFFELREYFAEKNRVVPEIGETVEKKLPTEKIMCTQEAKLCADGKTYVSRTGPNCEFAMCPKE